MKIKFKTQDMRWGNENPYLFLEDLEVKKRRNGVCREWHRVFGWVSVEREMRKTMNSHKKLREKLKFFLKKLSLNRKTRVFHDWNKLPTSRQGKPPKHLKSKLWKKFLSVFREWKVYLRGSRELSRKNLCVPLATRPFTCKQVTKINPRARGCSMRLGWPATELPKQCCQQGNTVFEIF